MKRKAIAFIEICYWILEFAGAKNNGSYNEIIIATEAKVFMLSNYLPS